MLTTESYGQRRFGGICTHNLQMAKPKDGDMKITSKDLDNLIPMSAALRKDPPGGKPIRRPKPKHRTSSTELDDRDRQP